MSAPIILADFIAVAAYAATVILGIKTYRDTDLDSGFWANFSFAAALGFLWTGVTFLEWVGIAGTIMDALGTSLLAVLIGVVAISSTGTIAAVEDLKAATKTAASRRAEAEEQREAAEEQRQQAEAAKQQAEEAKQEAERAKQESEELNDHLRAKAESFSTTMHAAAEGDFTQRMEPESRTEAMTEIATAFNDMMETLSETLTTVTRFAQQVDDSTDELSASAEEVRSASREVSDTVEGIASTADKQHDNVRQVTDEMTDLSATIEEIASSTDEVAEMSSQASELGAVGSDRVTDAKAEMEAIEQQASKTINNVESLDTEMEQIGEIVTVIEEIAEQTNMLALNASIEAARAGEAGEGFAVVADEIKGLAQETGDATQRIAGRIETIQASTAEAVDGIHDMDERVDNGLETVDETIGVLEDILEHVEEVNAGIQSVDDATDEQAASAEEVVAMVEEFDTMTERTSSNAQSAAGASEEQTAAMEGVTEDVVHLSDQADDLSDLLQSFEFANSGETGGTGDRAAATDGGVADQDSQ